MINIINGPNINLLGQREPEIYGKSTLQDLEELCKNTAASFNEKAECFQSNCEGTIIDILHKSKGSKGIILNPGGYTHTSVALRDAISAIETPVVEVHISNVYARESFRNHSYVSPVAKAVISGMGIVGYALAIRFMCNEL